MSKTWGRVLVGIAVLICLLAIGALEVMSQRVRVDLASTSARYSEVGRPQPSWDSLLAPSDFLEADPMGDPAVSTPEAARSLTRAVQAGRLTVLEVNEKDRRLLSVNGRGRVLTAEVGDGAATALARLKPGDVIRVEPWNGQIQRIVVLRQAWQEITSPEQ